MIASLRISIAACAFALAACSTVDPAANESGSIMETGLFKDLSARAPKADDEAGAAAKAEQGSISSFASTEAKQDGGALRFVAAQPSDDARDGAGDAKYRLNFENADLRTVVQAILGEALHINYVMNADVSGQVTISSPRPMTAEELLNALETLLQSNGFAMSKSGSTIRIGPAAVGGGAVDLTARATPGYGLSVVPLRHVSASTMSQLVSGFVVDADGLKVDQARNAMVVRGPGAERQQAVQAIMSFDADWMEKQSVGIYEVRRSTPDAVATELNRIFDSQEKGVGAGTVQFKAINRLHAVMVLAKTPALMKRAEVWIRRLDRDSASGAQSVFVYKARYRDCKELARVMTSLFQAGGDAGRGGGAMSGLQGGRGGQGGGYADQTPSPLSSSGDGSGGAMGSGSSGASGIGASFTPASTGQQSGSAAAGASRSGGGPAFNSPFFGDGSPGAAANADGSSADNETIDLTRQANGGVNEKILISADPANNSVVTYTDGYTYQKILQALRQLDRAPLQVAINATIAEVTLTDQLKNGVEYFLKSKNLGLGKDNGSVSLFGAAANVLSKAAPGFNVLLGSNSNPDVVISALDAVTNVEILSSPSLVVAENQPANFQVGDEVPIVTRQAQSVENPDSPLVNQVDYKDTGVILNVTPRIGQNDAVTMQIEQIISAVTDATNPSLTPTISKRRVASNISITSGQTVLLAGLISKKNQRTKSGIPILGDLKGVGNLFSVRGNSKERTELVVFIRPVVIRNGEDAASVAGEFRSRLKVLGAAEKPKYTK